MKKQEVYDAIDKIRGFGNYPYDRVANYIEANIDEFIECYDEDEDENNN